MNRHDRGQTLVEYGLLVGLVAIVVIAVLSVAGRKARDVYVAVNDALITASERDYVGATSSGPPPPSDEDWWTPYFQQQYQSRNPPLPPSLAKQLALKALSDYIDSEAKGSFTPEQKESMLIQAGGSL